MGDAAEIFSEEKISAALKDMIGTLTLRVSAYSAIKKDGVPLYKKARALKARGKIIPESELPIRQMKIFEAELLGADFSTVNSTKNITVRALFKVSSGTYIRSLAEELGRRFGYPATLKSLRRTKIGEFKVEDAETI